MSDESWFWWASTDQENYQVGPCGSRDEVIQTAINDELGMGEIDGQWVARFYIVEAQQAPLKIKDWIDLDQLFERADDNFMDSEFCGEDQDTPFFEARMDQRKDLIERINRACDEWQSAHELVFTPWAFTSQRNAEIISRDCGPVQKDGGKDE